jgi:hypothetical protein
VIVGKRQSEVLKAENGSKRCSEEILGRKHG